jgi:hypothetical protein
MGALKKADYYYGALLSSLINNGMVPALVEKENERRQIYRISTNLNDYILYSKYSTAPTGTKAFTWAFSFSKGELQEIKKLRGEGKELVFSLICSQKQLNDYNQEIAIVHWDEFIECIDLEQQNHRGTIRLSVKIVKGSKYIRIYGSNRADELKGVDNTIKIDRNRLTSL